MRSIASEIIDTIRNRADGVARVVKPWGVEHVVNAGAFYVKVIEVSEGQKTSMQFHKRKREISMIIDGYGCIMVYENGFHLRTYSIGSVVTIEPGTVHRAVGPLMMVEITSHENDDVVRVEDMYGRETMRAEPDKEGTP